MKNSHHHFLPLGLILFLFLLGSFSAVFFFTTLSRENQKAREQIDNVEAILEEDNGLQSGWRQHQNDYLGFTVHYPNGWQVRDGFSSLEIQQDGYIWSLQSDPVLRPEGPYLYSGILPSSQYHSDQVDINGQQLFIIHSFVDFSEFYSRSGTYWQGSSVFQINNPLEKISGFGLASTENEIFNDYFTIEYRYESASEEVELLQKESEELAERLRILNQITESLAQTNNHTTWLRYENRTHGYTLLYPSGWSTNIEEADTIDQFGERNDWATLKIDGTNDDSRWEFFINNRDVSRERWSDLLPCSLWNTPEVCGKVAAVVWDQPVLERKVIELQVAAGKNQSAFSIIAPALEVDQSKLTWMILIHGEITKDPQLSIITQTLRSI